MAKKAETHTSSVLYRKYRPLDWDAVLGQEHIVSSLQGSLSNDRISHAYLFSGGRGTGKTTLARIFARALDVSENDIYEIDAASNRGIDDIREIRDGVHVLPFESRYKVYIIDEVHMLTKEAFNALLKTLEEPPAHALFILATTETDKIPETVVSRCQVFSFKKPTREILKTIVQTISKKEGITLEAGGADLIALLGDGSFRDTLGVLQKVIGSAKAEKVSLKDIEDSTGAPKSELVNTFLTALIVKDKDKALSIITKAYSGGIAMKTFNALVLEKARALLLFKNAPSLAKELKDQMSEEDYAWLSTTGDMTSPVLLELLRAYDATGKAYLETLPLEMAVVGVCK
ncbi:MAG: DNA polymerase III subunit gamma/tau [Patescibacteria group bacterium]